MEETRTNLLTNSDQFNNWTVSGTTVTSNATTAPDGTLTADKIVETATTAGHNIQQGPITKSANVVLTLSVFAKAAERSWLGLAINDANGFGIGRYGAEFNLTDGHAYEHDPAQGTYTNGSFSMTRYPNGWFRCSVTCTTSTETICGARIFVLESLSQWTSASSYTGNGTSGIFLWGAQLEERVMSSYIPTIASSITRSRDLATISGRAFTSIYNQQEGTFKIEGILNDTLRNPIRYGGIISAGNGTSGFNGLFYNPSVAFGYYSSNDQQTPSAQLDRTYTVGAPYKIAAAYNLTEFSCTTNGGTPTTFNGIGAVLTSHKYFQVGGNAINQDTQGLQTISNISYYSRKLTDLELQTITR
jgi:hypothetical protein